MMDSANIPCKKMTDSTNIPCKKMMKCVIFLDFKGKMVKIKVRTMEISYEYRDNINNYM